MACLFPAYMLVIENSRIFQSTTLLLTTKLLCSTGCETWRKKEGVASLGGKLYPFTTLSDCFLLCLETSTCVAIDHSAAFCSVHTNINHTATTFVDPSYTQYTLNRACLLFTPTLPSLTSSSYTTQIPTKTTDFGL